jgi:hypothetical protein
MSKTERPQVWEKHGGGALGRLFRENLCVLDLVYDARLGSVVSWWCVEGVADVEDVKALRWGWIIV